MKKSDKVNLYYQTGIGYLNKGQPEEALNSFKQALELDSDEPLVLQGMGLAYFQMGILESGLVWLQKAKKLDPDNPELNNNLASIHLAMNHFEDALETSNQALNDPDYKTPAAAYYNRGIAYLNLGKVTEAEEDFKHASRLEPLFDQPLVSLGRLFFSRGDYQKAIEYLNAAIKVNNQNPEALLYRAQAKWHRGLITEAENDFLEILRQVSETTPIAKEARDWLDKIH